MKKTYITPNVIVRTIETDNEILAASQQAREETYNLDGNKNDPVTDNSHVLSKFNPWDDSWSVEE